MHDQHFALSSKGLVTSDNGSVSSKRRMTAVTTGWSREQDKAFEDALAEALPFDEEERDVDGDEKDDKRWEEIAAKVPGRTAPEVKRHYEVLLEDLQSIEAGKVPPPCYVGAEKEKDGEREQQQPKPELSGAGVKKGAGAVGGTGFSGFDNSGSGGQGRGGSKAEQERRKGIPWTEEEHKLFLLGLDKFGKGDWRSISRNFVISRTPTQVASHAQKYFIRLNSMNRDRRRASIHDITSAGNSNNGTNGGSLSGDHVPSPMNPAIMAAPAAAIGVGTQPGSMVKHPAAVAAAAAHHHPHHPQGHQHHMPPGMIAMYAPAVGQPAAPHMVSAAVGTPIMRPPPGHPPYVIPVAYPVPPSTMHP